MPFSFHFSLSFDKSTKSHKPQAQRVHERLTNNYCMCTVRKSLLKTMDTVRTSKQALLWALVELV